MPKVKNRTETKEEQPLNLVDLLNYVSQGLKALSTHIDFSKHMASEGITDEISRQIEKVLSDPTSILNEMYEKNDKYFSDYVHYRVLEMLAPHKNIIKALYRLHDWDHFYFIVVSKRTWKEDGLFAGIGLDYDFNSKFADRYPVYLNVVTHQELLEIFPNGKVKDSN